MEVSTADSRLHKRPRFALRLSWSLESDVLLGILGVVVYCARISLSLMLLIFKDAAYYQK